MPKRDSLMSLMMDLEAIERHLHNIAVALPELGPPQLRHAETDASRAVYVCQAKLGLLSSAIIRHGAAPLSDCADL